MIEHLMSESGLAEIFLFLMGLTVLIYAILDGYDLGIGMLLPMDNLKQRDEFIASIGPFWDANETWLVMAVGILLIAFPQAHSMVLQALYLPTALLLLGLIMRGVAFDFRAKAVTGHRKLWDRVFKAGSILATLTQGYMLGRYVLGFEEGLVPELFAALSAICVAAAYAYIGCAWLVMKTEGDTQKRAAKLGRRSGWLAAAGILAISLVNPFASSAIADRWFGFPEIILALPMPIMVGVLILAVDQYFKNVPTINDIGSWFPFVGISTIYVLSFVGLAYSFFPYVVPGVLTAADSASADASLRFILVGVVIVLPIILLYTVYLHKVFWGKSTELRYY
ncbi:MAG: cytochrome d ubiquinol oxidase subunit II [Oleibacter sp.]|nr:cytochrome d ubiquinol oxidase subunit II [Thalassolituus sp.]